MASRYWVGGTGTWDGSSTTNWSASSGGAGGASVPTTTDDVFFDSNSGSGTATISTTAGNCKNLTVTGYTGTITGITLLAYGDITLGTTATLTGLRLRAANNVASRTVSVDCGDRTVNELYLIADNATAVTNLASNAIAAYFYILGNGTVSLNNYNLTGASTTASFSITAGYTGTYNLGSGTLTAATVIFDSGSTSTINGTSFNVVLNSSSISQIFLYGKTVGSVSWNAATQLNWRTTGTTGSLTVLNSTSSAKNFYLWADATVTGTLTITKSGSGSLTVASDVTGTQRTLSAGSVSLTGVSFQDIAAAGAAIPFTGSGLVDLGNNTNILFSSGNGLFFGSNF